VAGNATSRAALLEIQTPPIITEHPQSRIIPLGFDVQFSVSATGGLPINYRWRKSGVTLTNLTLNANTSSYTLPHVDTLSAGVYSVILSNAAGSAVSRSAYVVVVQPPTNQVVMPGGTALFSARAHNGISSNSLSYQWRCNGVDLPGATSTNLYLLNVQCSQAGVYTFVVSNKVDGAAGFDAQLRVIDTTPPTLSCPSNLVFVSSGGAGTPVFYDVHATDACDTNLLLNCIPPSGSVFPIGTNRVICTAVDSSGNSNQCQFTVRVESRVSFTLAIAREGTNIVISWPKTGIPRQLEGTVHVGPAEWNAVTDTPEDAGDNYILRLPVTNDNKFFRLRERTQP
jgi:hypothetical protein